MCHNLYENLTLRWVRYSKRRPKVSPASNPLQENALNAAKNNLSASIYDVDATVGELQIWIDFVLWNESIDADHSQSV